MNQAPLSLHSFGPWGGKRGDPWTYRASNGIAEIHLCMGEIIKSIAFIDDKGLYSGTYGDRGDVTSPRENLVKIKIGWPYEYLKSISGTIGTSGDLRGLTSVSFTTNHCTHGPHGTPSGTDFTHPEIDNDKAIVGFHGRCGLYPNSLGTLAAPRHEVEEATPVGPFGGEGGSPWIYVTGNNIYKIVIKAGEVIESVSFHDVTRSNSATFGGRNSDDGGEVTVLIDSPTEYIKSISGFYGQYANMMIVKSLSFSTNERALIGPFGTCDRTADDESISSNVKYGKIIGFHGRAGDYIDSIGFYYKPTQTP